MMVIFCSIIAIYLYSAIALWAFGIPFFTSILYPRTLIIQWLTDYNNYLEKTVAPKLLKGRNYDKWL